ncbi:hypothetical protein PG989_000525 [Apiospora arundinis]
MSNVSCKGDLYIDYEASASQSLQPSHAQQYYQRSISFSTCRSESPPSYTPQTAAERPVVVPQQRPFATAPFFPAYAPSLRNHGIAPATWHQFVASMNEAVGTVPSVSDQALAHARSLHRRIRSASEGMWTSLSHSHSGNGSGNVATGRTSPLPGRSQRTLREERVIATLAAANIAWFHPRGLHVAMMDTTVLVGRLVTVDGGSSGDRRGIVPSRLIEAARPRRDEGPAAQLVGLRPWVAELEVDLAVGADPSKILDLAPDSLWLVVTCRSTGEEVPASPQGSV